MKDQDCSPGYQCVKTSCKFVIVDIKFNTCAAYNLSRNDEHILSTLVSCKIYGTPCTLMCNEHCCTLYIAVCVCVSA